MHLSRKGKDAIRHRLAIQRTAVDTTSVWDAVWGASPKHTCRVMASLRPARRRIACIEKLVLLALQLAAMVRIWQLMNTMEWPGREAGAVRGRVGE